MKIESRHTELLLHLTFLAAFVFCWYQIYFLTVAKEEADKRFKGD